MIFETAPYINEHGEEKKNNKIIFMVFIKDGRGIFIDKTTNKNVYYLPKDISKNTFKYESKNIIIKQSGNNEKEYLFSISKGDSYVEIFIFFIFKSNTCISNFIFFHLCSHQKNF